MMCFELKNINLCLLISTKNDAENMIGLINERFSKKEMGEGEEKGSVITPMLLMLNEHLHMSWTNETVIENKQEEKDRNEVQCGSQ